MTKPTPAALATAVASALVAIVYVGRKPVAYDNVAGSGKTWNGNGDVQEVTPHQASVLCKYPDQWARADSIPAKDEDDDKDDGKDNGGEGEPEPEPEPEPEAELSDNERVPQDAKIDLVALEKLTKAQLTDFAKQRFGKDMDQAYAKKAMIDQIEEWALEAD